MLTVKTTDEFDIWLDGLRDRKAQRRIAARLRKLSFGLFGDVKPVGEGVSEAREHSALVIVFILLSVGRRSLWCLLAVTSHRSNLISNWR